MTTLDQYIRNQYENNRFSQITDFDRLLANKANTGTYINMAALSEIARQLGADEIARGCQLEELHRMALNCAFEDLGVEVTPYRSVTFNVPRGNKALLQMHERAHFDEQFDIQEYVQKLRERLGDTDNGAKYHIVAVPLGITDKWESFGILIPESVLYNHVYVLAQDFWRYLAQLRNPNVDRVLQQNRNFAKLFTATHWIPKA